MKRFCIVIVLTAFIFQSCEPAATFDKPQPDNLKSLTSFPLRLQGDYLSIDQASIVTITDNVITRHYDFDYTEHKDSIGSPYKITGDTIIQLSDGTKEKILIKDDKIIRHENWIDTLFSLSSDNILKHFKGYYFLNSRYSDNTWEVKKISLKKGVLTVANISDTADIKKLRDITATTTDTASTHFTLTKRQFKTFVKQQGFGEQEEFNRMAANGKVVE